MAPRELNGLLSRVHIPYTHYRAMASTYNLEGKEEKEEWMDEERTIIQTSLETIKTLMLHTFQQDTIAG